MLTRTHHFAIAFYNFSCVFCFKWEDQAFKVSQLLALLNILKVPVGFTTSMSFYLFWSSDTVEDPMRTLTGYSPFTVVILLALSGLLNETTIAMNIIQVRRREKIKSVMNCALSMQLRRNIRNHFEMSCWKQSIIIGFVFSLIAVLNLIGFLKLNYLPLMIYPLFLYPNLVLTSYVLFIKNCESFVSALLHQFLEEIQEIKLQKNVDANSLQLPSKHQEIFKFVEQFNRGFGAQLTIAICGTAFLFVSQVRNCRNQLAIHYKLCFRFSLASNAH